MSRSLAKRRAAGIVAATLALGIAAPPAGARLIDLNSSGSFVPAGSTQTPATAVHATTSHPGGGISDWGYVAIGSGAASLALISVGGTRAASRRRRQRAGQPKLAS